MYTGHSSFKHLQWQSTFELKGDLDRMQCEQLLGLAGGNTKKHGNKKSGESRNPIVRAIANLKKTVLLQVVVVWKPSAECPGDGPTWRKCCSKNYSLTHSLKLAYLLVSQTID